MLSSILHDQGSCVNRIMTKPEPTQKAQSLWQKYRTNLNLVPKPCMSSVGSRPSSLAPGPGQHSSRASQRKTNLGHRSHAWLMTGPLQVTVDKEPIGWQVVSPHSDAWCLKASGRVLTMTVDKGPHPPGHHTRGRGLSDTEVVCVTIRTHWLHVPSRPQATAPYKWPRDFLGHGVSSHTNYDTIPDSAQEFVFISFSHSDM